MRDTQQDGKYVVELIVRDGDDYTPKTLTCDTLVLAAPPFAVRVLEELEERGLIPSLIVTAPDSKSGRGMILTPPAVITGMVQFSFNSLINASGVS